MNDRAIQLTPAFAGYSIGPVVAARLTITATQAVAMPTAVFAYLVAPAQPGQTETTATFNHVCSPADLVEYPEDAPDPVSIPAWFRASSVDLVFRRPEQADEAHATIVEAVSGLVAELNRLDALQSLTSVWLGAQPA